MTPRRMKWFTLESAKSQDRHCGKFLVTLTDQVCFIFNSKLLMYNGDFRHIFLYICASELAERLLRYLHIQ